MGNAKIDEWFRDYADEIYSFLVRFTGTYDVEDMLQETFLRAVKNLPHFRGDASPRTWLIAISRNVATDYFRRHKRVAMRETEADFASLPSPDSSPDALAELSDLRATLHQAIQTLKPDYRSVVTLRGILELSTMEAAETLGWSETKVRVTLYRALKALHRQLEKQQLHGGIHAWLQ